jgi:hypothetical protein
MEENYKSFHQGEGIIIVQAIIDNFFEKYFSLTSSKPSSEYGGGHGTAEEEPHSSPRWH